MHKKAVFIFTFLLVPHLHALNLNGWAQQQYEEAQSSLLKKEQEEFQKYRDERKKALRHLRNVAITAACLAGDRYLLPLLSKNRTVAYYLWNGILWGGPHAATALVATQWAHYIAKTAAGIYCAVQTGQAIKHLAFPAHSNPLKSKIGF